MLFPVSRLFQDALFYVLQYAQGALIPETQKSMVCRTADLSGPIFYIVTPKLPVLSYNFLSKAFASAEASIKSRKVLKGLVHIHNIISSLIFINISLESTWSLTCLTFLLEKLTYSPHTHRITQAYVYMQIVHKVNKETQTCTQTHAQTQSLLLFCQCFFNSNSQLNAAFRTTFQGFRCSAQICTAEEETKYGQPFLLN